MHIKAGDHGESAESSSSPSSSEFESTMTRAWVQVAIFSKSSRKELQLLNGLCSPKKGGSVHPPTSRTTKLVEHDAMDVDSEEHLVIA